MLQPSGPCPAKIMLVGGFPDQKDLEKGIPFSGYSGLELDKMLGEAGIMRSSCFVTTVCKQRPANDKIENFIAKAKKDRTPAHQSLRDKFVLRPIIDGIELLKREIEMCQPNVILALGDLALWALTGNWGITAWRGSEMESDLSIALPYKIKIIPTIDPKDLYFNWSVRQILVHDLRKLKRESETNIIFHHAYNFIIRPDFGQVIATIRKLQDSVLRGPTKIACDIETRAGHIACVGLGWSPLDAICIPFTTIRSEAGYWNETEEISIWYHLYKLLTHRNAIIVGQNFSYDIQYFHRHVCFMPNLVRDTMLAQHVMFSNVSKGLGFLSSMYREHHLYWKDEGKDWNAGNVGDENIWWAYNCKDCCATYEVDTEEQKIVDKMGLREVHDFQQALFWPVVESMNRGVRIDTSRRGEFAIKLFDEIASRQQWINSVLGHELNPKSPLQMQNLFYGDFKQKIVFDKKTQRPTCNEEALNRIAIREPLLKPLVRKITEIRSLGVFLSTFVNAPLDTDGRMRCSFNIGGTETFRFSSSENAFGSGMNMQNIPKGQEDDDGNSLELPNIRSLFIPDRGYEFFDIDLDSADLRIVQREAGIAEMGKMLEEGKKVYVEVGREYYKDPSFSKYHREYKTFKSFAHGSHYLGTAKGLAERIGLSVHETEKLQKWYYGKFPELKIWHDDFKKQVTSRRYVQNIFGYKIFVFDRIEGTIFNQMIAWLPQSTVACIINRGYKKLYNERKEIQVLLQVHDSLAGQYPSHLGDWAKREIKRCCEIELPYPEPMIIPVDIKSSPISWGACG